MNEQQSITKSRNEVLPPMLLSIGLDGVITTVYSDELAPIIVDSESSIRRASHVEPGNSGWWSDMSPVGGPMLGPYALRSEALSAEVRWLHENIL